MHGPKPLVWIVWLGMVLIGVEVRHLHARILDQPAATIPLFFCGIAVLLIPVCLLRTTSSARTAMMWLFAVGAVIGIVGVYYHTKLQLQPFAQLFTADRSPGPQPLAPLALTGLATIGILATRLISPEPREQASEGFVEHALDR